MIAAQRVVIHTQAMLPSCVVMVQAAEELDMQHSSIASTTRSSFSGRKLNSAKSFIASE